MNGSKPGAFMSEHGTQKRAWRQRSNRPCSIIEVACDKGDALVRMQAPASVSGKSERTPLLALPF